MTVRINKPAFNIREKLTEIRHKPIELVSVDTPEISLSGSASKTIEGIHETDHPIYLKLNGTSVGTANNHHYVRLGTEKDGIKSSQIYYWTSMYHNHTATAYTSNGNPGDAYTFAYGWTAMANEFFATMKIQRISKSSNTYFIQMSGLFNPTYPTYYQQSYCRVELADPLYSIGYLCDTGGGTTFDAGTISVQYMYERDL